MFGLVVNGRPALIASDPRSGIVQESETNWVVDIATPGNVSDISVFLTAPLPTYPDGQPAGLAVYYSPPPFQHWEFLGALSNARASGIFNAGWALNPAINECPSVRVGIRIEPASDLLPKMETVDTVDFRRDFARKVALNLFHFIQSFSQGPSRDGSFLRCPQDILDRWLVRFDEKYRRDPNFVLKTN